MKEELYKYYSTQRPVGPGTFPKTAENMPVEIVNYDDRIPISGEAFRAWGELTYPAPLTQEQIYSYELRPSRDNMDVRREMDRMAQIVGMWEDKRGLPEVKRFTWWYSDFGSYAPKSFVTPEQLADRYRLVQEYPTSRRQKKPPNKAQEKGR